MIIQPKTSYWKGKKVFVTGPNGFLGSWLVKALVERDAEVVALIRDDIPNSYFVTSGIHNKVIKVYGCLEDYRLLLRTLNEFEIDTIFHLGAQTIVTTANREPLSTFESNIKGTWNILEAARNVHNIKRIIIASTDKAYGTKETLPYTEDESLEGEHPYDVSKSTADLIAQAYFKTYGLPIGITRCGNIYGGGDLNFTRIVPGTIRSILKNEQPIIKSDGTYIRDYFYVEDTVRAYMTLAGNLDNPKIRGEAFNFSGETRLPVLEVVELITKLMKSKLKPKILNEVKHEIKEQYLSTEKAKSLLNWKPKSNIEEGLKSTIEWYKSYFQRFKI
jgi:CDP-glucose 4,6-dehydratase